MIKDSIKENELSDNMDITDDKEEILDRVMNDESQSIQERNNKITKDDILTPERLRKLLNEIKPEFLRIYDIIKVIGSGSESIVYQAIHISSQRIIAIKFIIFGKEKKGNYNEINIFNKFKNQYLISCYGFYEIKKGELNCIIMEYAKFGNIRNFQRNLIKKNYLSEQLLCFFSSQILKGIKYCHLCKITHFDIKPQNIIIDNYLNLKIIDFSVSIDYNKITSKKIKLPLRGTNFYIAPEVIKSQEIETKNLNKIDIYSFGVILYNLAFGVYPYGLVYEDVGNYDKIYDKIKNENLEFNNEYYNFSPYFIDFLKKILEKDINKRININEALGHYWIKGADILNDEKEKTFNAGSFLINLITDHIMKFDEYIKK